MMRRTIQSPGIEIRETDKSSYVKQDYSIVGTTSLVCGFAGKGENYNINWINTLQNFSDVYGNPETEEEKFFYNAAAEVFTRGGILLAARLPYANEALSSFAYTEYAISGNTMFNIGKVHEDYPELSVVDASLQTYAKIVSYDKVSSGAGSGFMTIDDLDRYVTNAKAKLPANRIRIVDITKSQYEKCTIVQTNPDSKHEEECLGIMPVIVTPMNALFYQEILSSTTSYKVDSETSVGQETTTYIDKYTPIADFRAAGRVSPFKFDETNFSTPLSSASFNDMTLSKIAASYFPSISFNDLGTIDRDYLKQIGVVVFQMYADTSNASRIGFRPVEAFVGSLSRSAKDRAGASIFIDDIINAESEYINFFSNCNEERLREVDILAIDGQNATALGLFESQCQKKIDYMTSIVKALNIIFENAKDPNRYNIDLVVDAGVSNIAQKTVTAKGLDWNYKLNSSREASVWKAVVSKFTTFCQSTRKDCMFIADGIRQFCLDNDEKIVRPTAIENSVQKDILPKLKYMSGVNSSYAAGYCNWFLVNDAYSGDRMWIPPSIKATGTYIYTDAYFNKWDAPAGLSRGPIYGAIDCAFSPSRQDAEKIYLQGWNYAVNYPLEGIITEGQKTFQLKPTAFDRVNVRRLFLYLEKEVNRIAKYFVYEGNTAYIRSRFVDAIRPIFEDAVNGQGVLDYAIRCDETNNTPQVIDNNELRCSIAVKPVKSIEFILLNFICTGQSANVVEVLND